jgi:2-haloacid dehalogenase
MAKDTVKAIVFDVFGTVVDWRTSLIDDLSAFGEERGIAADWPAFVDQWRGLYQPSMEAVRSGQRPWTILDVLHRESLDSLLARHGLDHLGEADRVHLTHAWHRLKPWSDVVDGLRRLKSRYIIGTLSNGNVGLLVRMAKNAGLPWDVILGAEVARAYKPLPAAYTETARILNLSPGEVMLVAAHNDDLAAAAGQGLRTAFVVRPTEYGSGQAKDTAATGAWDIVGETFGDVAHQMGC